MLGAEAVGLVGFFTTIAMVMMIFEGGLTSSLIQKLSSSKAQELRGLARYKVSAGSMALTYFAFFIFLGILISTIVIISSKAIVENWLNFNLMSGADVVDSLVCIGLFVGMSLPIMILQGVLIGRERQFRLNLVYIPYSLARTLGALIVVYFFYSSNNIKLYFVVQVVIQVFYLLGLVYFSFREFSDVYDKICIKFGYLKKGISFSRGVFFISITTVFVVQFDKIYLSGHSTLVEYAAYTLASTIAGMPYVFSSALNSVLFPRFSINLNILDETKILDVFRASSIGVVLLMGVLCPAIYFYGEDALKMVFPLALAKNVSSILPVLIVGTALQCLLIVPFALQLAAKWTSMSLKLNCAWLPIVIVVLPLLVSIYGVIGGAYSWLLYNMYMCCMTFYFVGKRFDFVRVVNRELISCLLFTIIIAAIIFNFVKLYANEFFNVYTVLCLESISVVIMFLCGFLVFKKTLLKFK
ncbi:hypothetical protein [Pseudomonas sp. EYE_354]|uniref:lipopolysaccharide biosynthesis protein n=1 Tax=Pseudomonas sp. EYE_354 TaxID=2853449 RepID=UPI002002CDC9|nr:hypothetical protein [Pseudomonas sp. EYE_354]